MTPVLRDYTQKRNDGTVLWSCVGLQPRTRRLQKCYMAPDHLLRKQAAVSPTSRRQAEGFRGVAAPVFEEGGGILLAVYF